MTPLFSTVDAMDKQNSTLSPESLPDTTVKVADVFGLDVEWEVSAFSTANEYVPDHDGDYLFNRDATLAPVTTKEQ